MTKLNENVRFVGHEVRGGHWVALFRWELGESFCADKDSTLARLSNLRNGGWAHDQTALAVANWPTEPAEQQ